MLCFSTEENKQRGSVFNKILICKVNVKKMEVNVKKTDNGMNLLPSIIV